MNTIPGPVTYSRQVAALILERAGLPSSQAASIAATLASNHGARIPEAAVRAYAPTPTSAVPTRAARSLAAVPRGCATVGDWAESARLSQWQIRRLLEALRTPSDPEPFTTGDVITASDFRAALRRVRGL